MNWTIVTVTALLIGGGLAALRHVGRRLLLEFGSIKLQVDDVHNQVSEINGAVNHRPEGAPTLYEHTEGTALAILGLHRKVDEQQAAHTVKHDQIDGRLTGIEDRLP